MRKMRLVLCIVVLALVAPAMAGLSGAGTYVETMNGTIGTWDRVDWVAGSLTDEADADLDGLPDSVTFTRVPGTLGVYEVYERGAVHLELGNVPTDSGVRLDSSFYQGAFGGGLEHWGMGVGVYFDADNMISLKRIRGAGGGLMVYKKEAGAWSASQIYSGYGFDGSWAMHGIELTDTQIKFYSSIPGAGVGGAVETLGSTDFDGLMTLDLSAATMARPTGFAGSATLLVGKGYDNVGGDPWDVTSDVFGPKAVYIDSTRVTAVPEPTTMMLLGLGGLVLRRKRS